MKATMPAINVLHLMTRLPVGGVEGQLKNVIRHYDKNRFNPLVCSLSGKGEIGAEIEAEGTEVVSLNRLGHRFSPSLVMGLSRLLKDREIHVLRTHQYHANLYGRLAARIAGTPCVVASIHNVYTRDRKPHRRVINRFLSGWTDAIVAVSQSVKRDIMMYDGVEDEKIRVIYNGVQMEAYRGADRQTARAGLLIPPDALVVGTVGRLTEQKGQKDLIDAAAALKDDFPDLRVLIVGDGPLRASLEERASSLGIRQNVIFTGSRRDVPEMLAATDVFVMPSLWEGLGIALIEAMAAGRPVVASDIPPFKEIMEDEREGFFYPSDKGRKKSGAISDKISLLLKDSALRDRMGEAARAKAEGRFSIENTVRTYSDLFDEILDKKQNAHISS